MFLDRIPTSPSCKSIRKGNACIWTWHLLTQKCMFVFPIMWRGPEMTNSATGNICNDESLYCNEALQCGGIDTEGLMSMKLNIL